MSFNKSVKTLTCDVWLSGYYYLMTGVVLHFINLGYGATSVDLMCTSISALAYIPGISTPAPGELPS